MPKPKVEHVIKDAAGEAKKMSPLTANLLSVAGIVAVTFIALQASLNNQFTNWDDPGYVVNQPVIKNFSGSGIREIFSTSIMGNYHPLTMLTLAFDYAKDALDPNSYHVSSLLFHLATTILVFCFVQLLTKKRLAAIISAVLFGLHPMHVESVAWVAGRKDVVYGMFYMASCIFYVYYLRAQGSKKLGWYAGVLIMFLCSLLSKPVAVILPVTLILIDFFEGRLFNNNGYAQAPVLDLKAINFKTLLDKIPLFLISVGFGWRSILDQKEFGALGTQGEKFNFIERIGLGSYALVTYLWKAIAPVKLLCFYPYPLKENGSLPVSYYIYPVIAIIVLGGVFWLARKSKAVLFGALFFLMNIALLLQFIPVGGAIIADRYSYIPYLGLFFMLGWVISEWYDAPAKKQLGQLGIGVVAVYCIVLGYLSNERCKVWYDGMSLWRDEIEIEPVRAPNGYNNLGFLYFSKFNNSVNPAERKIFYDSSYFLLSRAIQLQTSFVNPYISIGELLRSNNQFEESKGYYYKALKLDSSDMAANAYLGLAIVYSITQKFDSAYFCFVSTLRLKPYNPEAHSNYGNFLDMTGKADSAIVQYGIAIQQNPDIVQPYLNRARALQRKQRCDMAFADFEKALAIMPEMGEIYYARSKCYLDKGNKMAAIKDVEKARSLGFVNMEPAYLQSLK
jgi:Flp pilus assembly protein TadD